MSISIKFILLILLAFNTQLTKENEMINTSIKETKISTSDSLVLQYLIREPKLKSSKKKAIILLHGVGSNEQDLFSLANQLPEDFLIISPRGQFPLGPGRYAWYEVDFSTGKPVFNAQQEQSSREVIKKFVKQVKQKYHLDEVYLGGFSQGAIMSYSIGLTSPKEVRGIIVLSGRLLDEVKTLTGKSADLQQLKVFVVHGVQDSTLPIHYARAAKEHLQTLGVQLSYHEFNVGHQITQETLKELVKWLST